MPCVVSYHRPHTRLVCATCTTHATIWTAPRGERVMRLIPWLVLLLVWLWVSSASMVRAGDNVWTSTGPDGRSVLALALAPATPTTLYAGTDDSGVFKSTTGGSTWSAVNTGLANRSVLVLALAPATPTTLYAGTLGGGVFKSTTGGSTWS